MALHRRRQQHHYYRIRYLAAAVSAAVIVLFLVLGLLSPYPSDDDEGLHRRLRQKSDEARAVTDKGVVFRVPSEGRRPDRNVWKSRNADFYHGCSNASNKFAKADKVTQPNRYLLIATSGGLNQQRTGITDAVVAARILNATLVVPKLDQKSFWKDSSDFSEIFDVEQFISYLSKDVRIIKKLPKRGGKTWTPHNMRVPRKCNAKCYQNRVLPVLLKRHAIQITKFDYRLANRLDTELQKLRCRVNYHALKFTNPILNMGKEIARRMRVKNNHYIALHLRFEPDMLAFSGCYYGGGEKEIKELGAIRKRWKTLHITNPDKERRHGKCPLTPKEVGLMMRALGYGSDVPIYVASGEVYGGEDTLAPLKELFPNFHTKETIARKEELEPFSSFSSRMAALDFIVCDESNVFVTNNNGNMAKMLAGRRRYFGHKPTIRPNSKKLYRLYPNLGNLTWEAFASTVRRYQRGFMGEPNEMRPGRGEFHENPSPCICEDSKAKAKIESLPKQSDKENDELTKVAEVGIGLDEPDLVDSEDEEDQNSLQDSGIFNGTDVDYDGTLTDEPELEEMLSD
uniref:O-fucosyltransferase family protein n=1 Tax=Kalanchoe fedtschenkoi TaxID=63787 RepID=A0A7N0URW7_KALFE